MTQRAIVLGDHGRYHRVFLIHNAHVIKEWDTDEYLEMGRLGDREFSLSHFFKRKKENNWICAGHNS